MGLFQAEWAPERPDRQRRAGREWGRTTRASDPEKMQPGGGVL